MPGCPTISGAKIDQGLTVCPSIVKLPINFASNVSSGDSSAASLCLSKLVLHWRLLHRGFFLPFLLHLLYGIL